MRVSYCHTVTALVSEVACSLTPFLKKPEKQDESLENILHVNEMNAEKTMLWLQISQRARTFIFLLCKNISFKILVLQW